ncbi:Tetratricopeptide TPR_4 [Frankia sp. Hr75.2]|nr:Tetratricopeptide TPR_4 [Frankia sp. Hr75.2]
MGVCVPVAGLSAGTPTGVDVLISHAAADQAWAEWVAAELEAVGQVVRFRQRDLLPGANTVAWVDEHLGTCRRVLALFSEAYFQAAWCTREWTAALVGGRLVPIRVAECEPPELLKSVHSTDLFDVDEAAARHLLAAAVGLWSLEHRSASVPAVFPGGARAGVRGAGGHRPVPFPAGRPSVWNVPPRHRWFVGRDDLLGALSAGFRRAPRGASSQVLHGLAGVGKTQAAIEYAHRFAVDYSLVWWVAAEQPTSLAEEFNALAGELGLPEDVDLHRRGRRAVHRLREMPRWLVVFDSVVDLDAVAPWWPAGAGDILVTARGRMSGELGDLVEIGVFTTAESVRLLRRRAPHLTDGDAERIGDALGHLPLAVGQAAGYLSVGRTSAPTYLRLLERGVAQAFPSGPIGYPQGVLGAVTTAVEQLGRADPTALEVVRAASFLAAEPVSTTVLSRLLGPGADPVDLEPAVHALDRFAVARIEGDRIELHRLTQAVVRDQLAGADYIRYLVLAQTLLAQASAGGAADAGGPGESGDPGDPADPAAWPHYAEISEHVLALAERVDGHATEAFRETLLKVLTYLERSGQHQPACRLTGELLTRWRAGYGADAPDTLRLAHLRAQVLRRLGEHRAALDLDEDTLRRRRHGFGADARPTLSSADSVALDRRNLGERAAAAALHRQTWQTAVRVLGPDDPQTLDLAGNLAFDLYGLGEVAEARRLDEETLRRRGAILGPDHPATLSSAASLARDLRALGQHENARRLVLSAFDRLRSVLGPDHPDTLEFANQAAVDRYISGDFAGARALRDEILARCRRVLGHSHPTTLRVANDLGVDVHRAGDPTEARRIHQDALDRARLALGPDHPDTLHLCHNLARDLVATGEAAAARALLEFTLAQRERVLGPEHPETRRTARKLGEILAAHHNPKAGRGY